MLLFYKLEVKAHTETLALNTARSELRKAQEEAEAEKQALVDEHQTYLNKQLKVAEAEHAKVLNEMENNHKDTLIKVGVRRREMYSLILLLC